jgi:hypothetical protein
MELGGVNIFAQGMKFVEEKGSLGVTGRIRSVTRGTTESTELIGLWPLAATGLDHGTVHKKKMSGNEDRTLTESNHLRSDTFGHEKCIMKPLCVKITSTSLCSRVHPVR